MLALSLSSAPGLAGIETKICTSGALGKERAERALAVARSLLQQVLSFCGKPKLTVRLDKVVKTEPTI